MCLNIRSQSPCSFSLFSLVTSKGDSRWTIQCSLTLRWHTFSQCLMFKQNTSRETFFLFLAAGLLKLHLAIQTQRVQCWNAGIVLARWLYLCETKSSWNPAQKIIVACYCWQLYLNCIPFLKPSVFVQYFASVAKCIVSLRSVHNIQQLRLASV